ncbi:conserved hypothetical protein [Gammaproteobacteria bacterium]
MMPDFTRSLWFFQHYPYHQSWIWRAWLWTLVGILLTLRISDTMAETFPGLDLSREQAWAEQITGHLRVGEVVWLPFLLGRSLALYTKAIGRGSNHGAVVLLPSPNAHPDSEPISTLRTTLPLHGWHTLAVQLPTVLTDSLPADYALMLPTACARLREAIHWLDEKRLSNVVVLGHGLGAAVAAACVAEMGDKGVVRGIVLLGAGGGGGSLPPNLDPAASLEKITLPILDLYGEYDHPSVLSGVRTREAGRRNRERPYVQVIVPGADHRLTGFEDVIATRIAAWLGRHAPGQEIRGGG